MNQDQQPRPWWKDNWPILAVVALAMVIATITGLGYWQRWEWTGLVGVQENPDTKLAWDWLQLLIIPIALGAGAFWFNTQTRKSEQAIAQDRAQEDALQRYLDRMQELILGKWLRKSEEDKEIRDVPRARTLAVLRSLDGNRKGQVVRSLHEADLITGKIVREGLWGRQIVEAIIDLKDANLSGADLSRAVLIDANLSGANLIGAVLGGANLSDAILSRTVLSRAVLCSANLSRADLSGVNLSDAILIGGIRGEVILSRASLIYSNLGRAYLSGAVLIDANLSGTDLRGARAWTNKQLAQARSLVGAVLPDGTGMTEEAWEAFKKRYQ